MRARTVVLMLVAVLLVYLVILGSRGVMLVREGTAVAVALGIAVLILPVLGLVIIVAEVRFGRASEHLGHRLDVEGGLPENPAARLPSGRVDRASADAAFDVCRREAEAAPDDWRVWFRLAVAYGDAGDVRRGRAAMRRAIALESRSGQTSQDGPIAPSGGQDPTTSFRE